MSRGKAYARKQRKRVIKKKRKVAWIVYQNDYYPHLGQFDKGRVRVWLDARTRFEKLPDLREIKSEMKMYEQLKDYETTISTSGAGNHTSLSRKPPNDDK